MCIGGFRVRPRGVLPLGKEGERVLQVQMVLQVLRVLRVLRGAVRRIIIESAAEF